MKKIGFLVICLVLAFSMLGCDSKPIQVIENGAPLCREDFYVYDEGKIIADPDENEQGVELIYSSSQATARGITADDSIDDIKKAYAGCETDSFDLSDYDSTSDYNSITYAFNGFELHFKLSGDKIDSISIFNPTAVERVNQQVEEEMQKQFGDQAS